MPITEPGDAVPGLCRVSQQASLLWQQEGFDGCTLCRRDRKHVNPTEHERPKFPTLRFRSDRHYQCNLCMTTLRKNRPDAIGNIKIYAKELEEDLQPTGKF